MDEDDYGDGGGQVFGFADQAEFDRAADDLRWVRERRGLPPGDPGDPQTEAVCVLIEPNSAIQDGSAPPSEANVFLCSPMYRNLQQTDPTQPDAWVRYAGPTYLDANSCEAFGPNGEALTVGSRYNGRCVGVSAAAPFRPRVKVTVGGGAGGPEVVVTSAANDGTQWTAAVVQGYTSTGGLTAATPAETVDVQPLKGAAASGEPFFARDTGRRSKKIGDPDTGPFTGNRRLRLERAAPTGGGPPAGYVEGTVITNVQCYGDGLHVQFAVGLLKATS